MKKTNNKSDYRKWDYEIHIEDHSGHLIREDHLCSNDWEEIKDLIEVYKDNKKTKIILELGKEKI